MFPWQRAAGLALYLAATVTAQTKIDLEGQSKNIDFSNSVSTKPVKVGTTIPVSCTVGDLFFKSDAAAGQNLYACVTANTWTLQSGSSSSGSITVLANGTTVGSRATQNIIDGAGILTTFSDTGTQINITHSANTALLETKAAAQAGGALLCASASGSGASYACSMQPTLTGYTAGAVLAWKPDVAASGGATTLNIDGLGAVAVKLPDGTTNPRAADLASGQLYQLWYDGAVFRLLGGAPPKVAFGSNIGAWEPWAISSLSGTRSVPQSGAVHYFEFTAPMSMSAGFVGLQQSGSTAKYFAVAFYDASCALIAQSTALPFTASATAVSLTLPVTLKDATAYFFAISSDSTAGTDTVAVGGVSRSSFYNLGTQPRFFTGSNTATWISGTATMPATCGTKTTLSGDAPATLLFN